MLYPPTLQVKKWVPDLQITYSPDSRQEIADSWPMVFDDQLARHEWDWQHDVDLAGLVEIMITNLRRVYSQQSN